MFSRVLFLVLPISFWYLQHKISLSICYQVSDCFHFILYKNFTIHVEKVFISSKILIFLYFELSDSPLNFSPEKLYHTIWFIISKTDIFCWELENNRYGTLNAVVCLSYYILFGVDEVDNKALITWFNGSLQQLYLFFTNYCLNFRCFDLTDSDPLGK